MHGVTIKVLEKKFKKEKNSRTRSRIQAKENYKSNSEINFFDPLVPDFYLVK